MDCDLAATSSTSSSSLTCPDFSSSTERGLSCSAEETCTHSANCVLGRGVPQLQFIDRVRASRCEQRQVPTGVQFLDRVVGEPALRNDRCSKVQYIDKSRRCASGRSALLCTGRLLLKECQYFLRARAVVTEILDIIPACPLFWRHFSRCLCVQLRRLWDEFQVFHLKMDSEVSRRSSHKKSGHFFHEFL